MVKALGGKIKMIYNLIDTLESILKTKSMVTENFIGRQVTYTKVPIITMSEMAMVKCTLQMVRYIKAIGHAVSRVVKEHSFSLMVL